MRPFTAIDAPALPLGLANVDTDQLIPARFMKTPRAEGYGRFLLHDQRRDAAGELDPGFVLNDPRFASAEALIARRNFGCGSSREAAVYVLIDSAIRCVVAPSFADIFASNAAKNGLLAAVVSEADAEAMLAEPAILAGESIAIDLDAQTIACGSRTWAFDIRPDRKLRLINGWSDLDLTRSHAAKIAAHKARDRVLRPWATAPDLSGLQYSGSEGR